MPPDPDPIDPELIPGSVKLEWCHNGAPKTKNFTPNEGESADDFCDRVGAEATEALHAEKPTGDCDPPFPA